MTRFQFSTLATVALLLMVSLIGAPYPQQMYLQHIPTVLVLVGWPLLGKRVPLTNPAFLCISAFLLLHIVAARYIYSYVPYDLWSQKLLGFSLTERFDFQRNHFDRAVHFSFGALFVRPVWEICVLYLSVPRRFAYYVGFEFVLAFSMLYELFEWGLSLLLAAQDADAYNGQQGDMWDAQKDMALALLGALISLAFLFFTRRSRADLSLSNLSRSGTV